MNYRVSLVISCFATFTVFGCSKSTPGDGPELAPATGIVTMDGAPLSDATVSFSPVGGGRGASGRTDESGRFELAYIRTKGSPIGDCVVSISTRDNILDEYGGQIGMKPETIPKRYRDQNSELKATVTDDGSKNVFEFELNSQGVTNDLD